MAPAYRIEIQKSASKELASLEMRFRRRVDAAIRALSADPRPPGVKKLQGPGNLWRIRVGDYRVIYRIQDEVLLVLVIRIADRKDVYKGM